MNRMVNISEQDVERLHDRLTMTNECIRVFCDLRGRGYEPRPGWLEEELALNDEFLNRLATPESEDFDARR